MKLRGTPDLGRIVALPACSLVAAALSASLAWTVLREDRWLIAVGASALIFGVYELIRAQRILSQMQRVADDWLRSATGAFVAPAYAWRAEQLCSPGQRRMLARTLRLIERSAYERPVGRLRPMHLPAVREHRQSVELLARKLERLETPVTPAGILRVVELVTDGASPLWATTKDAALGDAIATTLSIMTPAALARAEHVRAA